MNQTNQTNLMSVLYILAFIQCYCILISIITCYSIHIASSYDMEQLLQNTAPSLSALVIPCMLICFVWGPMFAVEMWIRDLEKQTNYD